MNAKAGFLAKEFTVSAKQTFRHNWENNRTTLASIVTVGVGIFLSVFLLATAPGQEELPVTENVWPVSALVVKLTDSSPMAPLFGRVEAPREAKMASRLAADVVQLRVQEGDLVKKGQTLLRMNEAEWHLAVKQKEANLSEATAQLNSIRLQVKSDARLLDHQQTLLRLTESKLARQKSLLNEKMISQASYDESVLESQQQFIQFELQKRAVANASNTEQLAEARVARARAELELAHLELSYATVLAPFDGVVSKVWVSEGDRLQVGTPTLQIFDPASLQVRATIPSDYVSQIKAALAEEKPILASAASYQHIIPLQLDNLTSSLSANGASVDGLFRVQDSYHGLALGQMVSLALLMPEEHGVVIVPPQALYDQGKVYAIEDGRLVPIEVDVVGERRKQGQLELLLRSSNLRDGIVLLGSRLANAKAGLKVDPSMPLDQPTLAVQRTDP